MSRIIHVSANVSLDELEKDDNLIVKDEWKEEDRGGAYLGLKGTDSGWGFHFFKGEDGEFYFDTAYHCNWPWYDSELFDYLHHKYQIMVWELDDDCWRHLDDLQEQCWYGIEELSDEDLTILGTMYCLLYQDNFGKLEEDDPNMSCLDEYATEALEVLKWTYDDDYNPISPSTSKIIYDHLTKVIEEQSDIPLNDISCY